jgi:hypothetical protein
MRIAIVGCGAQKLESTESQDVKRAAGSGSAGASAACLN